MVYCDNDKCSHNRSGICSMTDIYLVDVLCVSRRKKEPEEDYTKLMRQAEPIGFRRGNKWVQTK